MLSSTPVGAEPSCAPFAPPPPGLVAGSGLVDGVVALDDPARRWGNAHDRSSRDELLRQVADYLAVPLLPPVAGPAACMGRPLIVPGDTVDLSDPAAAGIADAAVLGGVVPFFFVGTKAIAHGLVTPDAARPAGWSTAMAALMGGAALAGYTAFTRADAALAGRLLLRRGPVRIKDVCGKAGLGQQVVRSAGALDAALALEEPETLARCGLVLEENLADVATYSVGTVQLGADSIAYWGGQNLTTDHEGREVYGGSDLFAVRGGLDALRALDLPEALARAVDCADAFDRAAHAAYPGIRLTRRNYDVIAGTGHDGAPRIAVLEQSWRVGGASGAEIMAFEALRAEPDTAAVRCSTIEHYDVVMPPAGAVVYFCGDDPTVGPMTKYAMRLA